MCLQDGLTAVMVASKNGHLEVVKELLKAGADTTMHSKVIKSVVGLLNRDGSRGRAWGAHAPPPPS